MKNILLVLLAVVVFGGCSKDDEKKSSNSILVKKIEIEDGTVNYNYNGNKLNEIIEESGDKLVVTYNGDLIVKTQNFQVDGLSSYKAEYFYENNKLKSKYSTDGIGDSAHIIKTTYLHNIDGTLNYKTYIVDAKTKAETLLGSGVYTFLNGNIVKDENPEKIKTFEYDDNNYYFKNVLGIDKLIGENSNQNNILKETITHKGSGTSNVRSYEYDYNPDGYPIVQRYFFDGKPYGTTKYSY